MMASVFWDAKGIINIDYIKIEGNHHWGALRISFGKIKVSSYAKTSENGQGKEVVQPRKCAGQLSQCRSDKIYQTALQAAS